MFYRPADGHGLRHNPFTAIISPRPIAWLSTTGSLGDNLAPYSFFNAVAYVPPQVMFASTGIKDSVLNIRETGVFCVNIVEEAMLQAMSNTSATVPRDADEFALNDLRKQSGTSISCPRLEGAPAALECTLVQEIALRGTDNVLILGEVTGIHLRDDCLVDGRFDVTRYNPVARLGYRDYTIVREVIERPRPDEG
jgi:flavin reductase (DIM6/NTAB) family NADH-FMN oxidoreductase RutF